MTRNKVDEFNYCSDGYTIRTPEEFIQIILKKGEYILRVDTDWMAHNISIQKGSQPLPPTLIEFYSVQNSVLTGLDWIPSVYSVNERYFILSLSQL